jgi:hypothetical protein
MLLLSAPFDPGPTRRWEAFWTPASLVMLATLALLAVGLALETRGGIFRRYGWGVASAGVHSGFLALGWVLATGGRPGWRGPAVRLTAVLLGASIASRFSAWGALLFLLVPIFLLGEGSRRPALRAIGLSAIAGVRPVALGLAAGAFLGVPLLISASQTFGYTWRVANLSQYLAAVAYDVGANALTAEWLFRGALFSRWWRRWQFWPAAGLVTALVVVRYLLDPALPSTLEVRAAAIFYISLLSVSACALRAGSGSLLPGYLATLVFFAAYRLLGQ